ncbi:MAG TPA: S46 family peptidase [Candidatus Deferrimicrobium sp.]|nr:S46 family peptidase [Candidatus Deferrimicrobium sp.]
MKRIICSSFMFVISLTFLFFSLEAEEGMYPLSEINKLDLRAMGFQLDADELYNPQGVSLIDAVIDLRGCSASFISADGLILTNYHCAFGAIQGVTTPEKDYFRDGFLARDRSEELEAKNYTVRIIESYRDVSSDVLSVLKKNMTHTQRAKAINEKMNRIVTAVEKKKPGTSAEVAEMFQGKTYVLFIYRFIKDVRLVYAPPRSIGEFGGELDNWMWPRHTGDFALMRAYVKPDGATADYARGNVPFHPKKYLAVAPEGVQAEDFVFILGYPGTTYRHDTSHFLAYEEEVRMPYVVDLYDWIIQLKEKMSRLDRATAIKLSASLKGLWNNVSRSRGQLKGLKNLQLVEKRREKEKALQEYIASDSTRQKKYGKLLDDIKNAYDEKRLNAGFNLTIEYLVSSRTTTMMSTAFKIYSAACERQKKDTEREEEYLDRNFDRTLKRVEMDLRNYYEPADKAIFKELLTRAANLEGEQQIPAVQAITENGESGKAIDAFIEKAYKESKLNDPATAMELFKKSERELRTMTDPFIVLARGLYPSFQKMKEAQKREKGILDPLLAQLIDVKKEFIGKDFIPDANSTMRLSFGRIRGYFPTDAVCMKPFTTLGGVVEKHNAHNGQDPYTAPQKLIDLWNAKDFGQFRQPGLDDVPVAMLYNTDTTGGNSGSPVLNAKGQLVGLNFDRVFEATINDYAWDESYSRSIGVDIRYILWFLKKFSAADYLLKEMGVL